MVPNKLTTKVDCGQHMHLRDMISTQSQVNGLKLTVRMAGTIREMGAFQIKVTKNESCCSSVGIISFASPGSVESVVVEELGENANPSIPKSGYRL